MKRIDFLKSLGLIFLAIAGYGPLKKVFKINSSAATTKPAAKEAMFYRVIHIGKK